MPAGGEVTLSYIINTSEYCAEVVPQLEQMVQQKMKDELQSRVDYNLEVRQLMISVLYGYLTEWPFVVME